MSVISAIDGEFLVRLSGGEQPQRPDVASQVAGKGAGTSFDAVRVDVRAGLNVASASLARSLERTSGAVAVLFESRDKLKEIETEVDKMRDLADAATQEGINLEERARLNSEFKESARKIELIIKNSEIEDTELLKLRDIQEVLEEAGIDKRAPTELASRLSGLGGDDRELGTEDITLPDGNVIDPLKQTLDSVQNAATALEAVRRLDEAVADDVKRLDDVIEELNSARTFARVSIGAFQAAEETTLSADGPEQIAESIVRQIKAQASDPSIVEHSGLDTKLRSELGL